MRGSVAVITGLALVAAHEDLTATGHGVVTVKGERRRLRPKGGPRHVGPEGGNAMKLLPTTHYRVRLTKFRR